MWREIVQKTTWKLLFKAVFRFSCFTVTAVWLFDWLTSDIKATFILLEWILIQPNQRCSFFPQQRRRTLWGRGRANKLFLDEDIYWRLLGILFGFPPKKTLSWNRDKNNEIPKNSDWCSVCSFTSRFPFFFFSFLQQRCQRRAQPKQTDNRECTMSINTSAWGRRSSFTSLNEHNKMTRSMYCKNKKKWQKKRKNKGQKKQIIFIFLLISCFRHFCFELLII